MFVLSSGAPESVGATIIMCLTLLAISSPIMYAGWKNKQRFEQVSEAREGNQDDTIIVSGSIKNASDRIVSPFESENCSITLWDVSTLMRTGTVGSKSVWSQEIVGIQAGELVIEDDGEDVAVTGFSDERKLDTGDQIKRALVKDTTSKFSSVEMELESDCFEKIFEPVDSLSYQYKKFAEDKRIERATKDSYDFLGKLLRRIRVPSDSIRYREKNFEEGDNLTIIGRNTDNGVLFEETEEMSPLISSKPISKILRRYRLAYILQLYCVPIICVLFSGLMGYAAYL